MNNESIKNKYYITTPIYYVNDSPHIGHAYTNVVSDVIARFMRLKKIDVKFLTGTDEHGQKIQKSAEKAGIEVQEFVDGNAKKFVELFDLLKISNDDFIRTTENRHKVAVEYLWNLLKEKGYIYLGKYSGWYSTRDEAFYAESEITDKKAPTGAPVEWIEEESYFFRLSEFQNELLDFYKNNPDFIKPKSRYKEVINFVSSGLDDLSISRTSFDWGVRVPNHTSSEKKHVVYVWLDALVNYISALGFPNSTSDYRKFWHCDVHVLGKDILRFHAIYWPAFLMAADIDLPKSILAHGWWTNNGEKISKSLGNTIDPIKLVNDFGLDRFRYFLIRETSFNSDGNFSEQSLIMRSNSELSNKIGNLVQRVLIFILNNCDAKIPEADNNLVYEEELIKFAQKTALLVDNHICDFELNIALEKIVELVEAANVYIDFKAPWKLKERRAEMNFVIYTLVEAIRYIAVLLLAFIPDSASKILDYINLPDDERYIDCLKKDFAVKSSVISKPEILFSVLHNK